jgi:fermentation-respiration switch protein FrsA (DUF1100 family)
MTTLKSVIITLLVCYGGLLALLFFAQRSLMYFPDRMRVAPSDAGLPQAEEVVLETADGEKVIAWHIPPQEGRPVVIYFHGNGGALHIRVGRFRALTAGGDGLVALSYRGYGGSTGRPSEAGLLADAAAAHGFAVARHPMAKIVLWGESLGSGVAIALAKQRPVGGLVLEAPFTSAVDIAAAVYPFVPVRLLMLDQFRSDEHIGAIKAPVLILHGERDRVVPIAYGERLFALAHEPKKFVRFPQGDHNDLDTQGAIAIARHFIAELPE